MAKVTGMIGNITGSIGALTFSRSRAGAVIRRRSVPCQPQSQSQMVVRAAWAQCGNFWLQLAGDKRTAWQEWADAHHVVSSQGESVRLTGQQAWTQLQTRIQLMHTTPLINPPSFPVPPALVEPAATMISGSQIQVSWVAGSSVDWILVAWFGPGTTGRRYHGMTGATLWGGTTVNPTSPVTIDTGILNAVSGYPRARALNGSLVYDLWVQRWQTDGQVSVPVRCGLV